MRIVVVIILLTISSVSIMGADYLDRSFRWEVGTSAEDGIIDNSTIRIGSDTIINSIVYRFVGNVLLRQSSDSILMIDRQTKEEILLYNFALQEGDSIEMMEDPYSAYPKRFAKVIKVDTIKLKDGRKARCIMYDKQYIRDVDIQFVGSSNGGILGPLNNSAFEYKLKAFYDGNLLLYGDSEESINFHTNVSCTHKILNKGMIFINNSTNTYTLYGQKINNLQP